jgi:PHD/YefM family antitoxin component YafN of YafNO toxin-antitoxin module
MPAIRNSADLVNNFSEIRDFCQKYREPIFLTNNGRGELAVMSIDAYEELVGRMELYHTLQQGLDQIDNGDVIEEDEMIGMLTKTTHSSATAFLSSGCRVLTLAHPDRISADRAIASIFHVLRLFIFRVFLLILRVVNHASEYGPPPIPLFCNLRTNLSILGDSRRSRRCRWRCSKIRHLSNCPTAAGHSRHVLMWTALLRDRYWRL